MTETELTTMMAIVQYTDGCLYTCKFTDIGTKRRNLHSVKYQDQKQYAARILIFGADRAMLDQLHSHFQGDVPFVRFKSLVHTGICLTSSQILQQAKKLPADGKKLYINELIAPSYDSMDAECFRFDVDKDFSHNGKNEKFFEAVLFAEKAKTQVLETNQPTYEKSQLPESSSVDISSIENGNHSNRTNSGKECEEDRKSSNTANIDSSQITPAAAVAFTQCQTDLCKDYKDGYVFSNVMEIDSSKPPASSNGIFTTCDVYSTKESKVDPESWNTAAILQETENMPEDISSMNNGDDAKRIVCGKECDKNLKSSNIAEIDSFQLTPAATAMFTQCQTDSGKEHSDGRAFLNVTEIDSPEFATTLIGILTTGATDSSKESKVDPKSAKATGVDRTTMSSYAKPKIISNDPVEFGIIRIPFNADSTYHVDSLSVIGAELDQDSSMLQDLHSHIMNGVPIDEALNSAIPSEDVINGSKSYNSYEDHFPVMSSTIVESTTMNSLKDVIEDSNDIDDDDKDKDYELSEESEEESDIPGKVGLPNVSMNTKTEANNTSILNVSVRKRAAPDDTYMSVATSATASYTKKQSCLYCKTMQSKLARHLEQKHASEVDVKKFVALPKRNRERQQIIAAIRKDGNQLFNTDGRFNDGSLLVCRRPNEKMNKTAQDFMACAKCKGQYARSVIRHHWRKCTKRVGNADRIVMVKGRAVMGRFHKKANDLLKAHLFSLTCEKMRLSAPFDMTNFWFYMLINKLINMVRSTMRIKWFVHVCGCWAGY